MFHCAANFVAIAATANTEVPALQDDVLQLRSNRHVPTEDMKLYACYSSAVTLLRTRLNTPQVRKITPAFIVPIGTTLLPADDPSIADFRDNPLPLMRDEAIVYESTDSAAGPNNHYIISWLSPRLTQAPKGYMFWIRGTGTTAAVASTWTTAAITWDADLTEGMYSVVGAHFHSTTAVAFQLIFENQTYRPGGLGGATADIRAPFFQYNGGLGEWGRFRSLNPPLFRMLCNAADVAQTVYLQVVRVGGSPVL
jgi:hypothetical protein